MAGDGITDTSSGLITGVKGLSDPGIDSENAKHDIIQVFKKFDPESSRNSFSLESKVKQDLERAMVEWFNEEASRFNDINPSERSQDREKLEQEIRAFLGGPHVDGMTLEDSSTSDFVKILDLVDQKTEPDPGKFALGDTIVEEAIENFTDYRIENYSSGNSRRGDFYIKNGSFRLRDGIGAIQEDGTARTVKLEPPQEYHRLDAAVKLLAASEENTAEEIEIIYPLETEEDSSTHTEAVDMEEARKILGAEETGIQNLLDRSSREIKVILDEAAKEIDRDCELDYRRSYDSLTYLDIVARTEGIGENWREIFWKSVRDQLDEKSSRIGRDQDEEGRRVYRWDGNEAYSVTTVLDSEVLDLGEQVFFWENRYDGEDGRYDSNNVKEFAGPRGTLAHEKVFEKYVEDSEEVSEGNSARLWNQLEQMGGDELEDLREWGEREEVEFYEDSSRQNGFIENGRQLAENDIEWIEQEFRDLEESLGLRKENVIAAEKMFGISTKHPWDKSEKLEGPGIGKFEYAGQIDLLYEKEDTGETILLDLKTSKDLYDKHKIQSAAYAHAVENSEFFDVEEVDRVVIPVINPETMKGEDRDPEIHTDTPHPEYTTANFLKPEDIDELDTNYWERKNSGPAEITGDPYPVDRWRPETFREEALYLFARAAESLN
ncbi:MAG: hypothetical protein ABEJ56_07045 [Candidatus Nanohaloarchaea archaeon]